MAGINSLPFAIFVTQNKEKMNLRERFETLCSRLGVEFQGLQFTADYHIVVQSVPLCGNLNTKPW